MTPDKAVEAYFSVHPLDGPRDETEVVIDILMRALRVALGAKQASSARIARARDDLNQAEGELRHDEHVVAELWRDITMRAK